MIWNKWSGQYDDIVDDAPSEEEYCWNCVSNNSNSMCLTHTLSLFSPLLSYVEYWLFDMMMIIWWKVLVLVVSWNGEENWAHIICCEGRGNCSIEIPDDVLRPYSVIGKRPWWSNVKTLKNCVKAKKEHNIDHDWWRGNYCDEVVTESHYYYWWPVVVTNDVMSIISDIDHYC